MSTQLQTQAKAGSKSFDALIAQSVVKRHFSSQRGFSADVLSYPIQTKLKIGQQGDKYEQEANRVAEQVMRMPEPVGNISTGLTTSEQPPIIQRMCPECEEELNRKPISIQRLAQSTGHNIQRQCNECDEELQRQPIEEEEEEELLQAKESTGHTPTVTPKIQNQIGSLRGGGQPLSEFDRSFFESRFGYDFSQVRVHSDSRAAESAHVLKARAYTIGSDIAFGFREYAPGTLTGRRLLAHELTHVVQQKRVARFSSRISPLVQLQPNNCTAAVTQVPHPRDPRQEVNDAHGVARDWGVRARDQAQVLVNGGNVRPFIRSALDFHFSRPSGGQLTTIRNLFNGIVARLNRGSRIYYCNTTATRDCQLAGTEAATFCPSTTQYTRICPHFFQITRLARPLTLVHEAAHAAGACGHIYTNAGNYPGANPQTNAEAYAQFTRTVGMVLGRLLPLRRRTLPVVPPVRPTTPVTPARTPPKPTVPPPTPDRPTSRFIEQIIERGPGVRERIIESTEEIGEVAQPISESLQQMRLEDGRGLSRLKIAQNPLPLVIQRQPAGSPPRLQLQAPYFINFTNVAPPASPDNSLVNPGPSSTGADRAGFVRVTNKPRMSIAWDNLLPAMVGGARTVPLFVRSANIFFRLDPIAVFVSSQYAVGSCPYRVTKEHEYQHVSAFLRIFHRHRETMVRRANAIRLPTEASPKNVLETNIDGEQARIEAPIVQAVKDVRDLIGREARADRNAKDAPAAYARVHARCPRDEW